MAGTPAVVLLHAPGEPKRVTLAGEQVTDLSWDPDQRLLWIRFTNTSSPRVLTAQF